LFSAVISEHFSKNCVIMSVVATNIWYLKNVQFSLGHPVQWQLMFWTLKRHLFLLTYFTAN